jgi:hypothetical protein
MSEEGHRGLSERWEGLEDEMRRVDDYLLKLKGSELKESPRWDHKVSIVNVIPSDISKSESDLLDKFKGWRVE